MSWGGVAPGMRASAQSGRRRTRKSKGTWNKVPEALRPYSCNFFELNLYVEFRALSTCLSGIPPIVRGDGNLTGCRCWAVASTGEAAIAKQNQRRREPYRAFTLDLLLPHIEDDLQPGEGRSLGEEP